MPKLTVDGVGDFEVPQGKRLVLALEDEAGIDQLHACGGNARCTTCRVEFVAGEPPQMTVAEKAALAAKGVQPEMNEITRVRSERNARSCKSSIRARWSSKMGGTPCGWSISGSSTSRCSSAL